ncbi:response regulator [Pleomorphovibrio marinus]|uniref:response regulator n=1 Tax=Pleomorphovibrio marinus TaxID=2164132 RepID=UPI000E0C3F3C|nr:response regulator [Pleomorphovibrio marinus]
MVNIVLIDDDAVSNFVTEKFIKKHIKEPCRIFKFSSATDALNEIYKINPKYMFVDLLMPQMTGMDFLETLNEKYIKSEIYVLSSSVNEKDVEKVANCHKVKKFLPKVGVKQSIEEIFGKE